MITRWRGVFLACAAAGLALTAAACGDDGADSSSSAQQGDVDALSARIQRNEVMFAIKAIGDLPLHDMAQSIDAGDIPNDALPNTREVVRVTALTDWPDDLQTGADDIQAAAVALVQALDAGGGDAAQQPATDLHEAWHQFEHEAWAAIGHGLPPEAGIADEDHDAGETPDDETPAAEGTPPGDEHSE